MNALWDLWGKIEGKPVWKLLVGMSPDEIVSLVDFTHLLDVLTPDEARMILAQNEPTRLAREQELSASGTLVFKCHDLSSVHPLPGYPCYITSVGWLGYSDQRIQELCQQALKQGFTRFKMKVGVSLSDDCRRAKLIRAQIGWEYPLMMDANQVPAP